MRPLDFDRIAEQVRNWGRWGSEDQRGTLNHIGPEVLQKAVASVQDGRAFSLGLNFDKEGPQRNLGGRFNPLLYVTQLFTPLNPDVPEVIYSDDVIHMPLQAATQWDALGHVHYDGVLYNGCTAASCLSSKGAARLGVENLAQPGIMSRAVLLDVARYRGVERLPLDYAISVDDLEAVCAHQGSVVEPGDIVMIRTGHMRAFTVDRDRDLFAGPQPGLSYRCAEWIHDKSVAAVAADNVAVEQLSPELAKSDMPLAFHMLALRDMGCPLGEMFHLEELAADCARDGRYAMLLAAPPLAVTGAFGSPVNPLVLK